MDLTAELGFEPTEGQRKALEMVADFMQAPAPMPAVLTGFSGTGKTTLIRVIADRYQGAHILAPTGKASLRVREATGHDASTIHRWLYTPMQDQKTGETKFDRKPNELLDIPFSRLIIVDEASMVGRDVWEALWDACLVLNLRILLVGDVFQLPPVEGKKPDKMGAAFAPLKDIQTQYRAHLSEITRQALGNPIIRASMMIRESSRIYEPLELLNRVFSRDFDDKCLEVYRAGGAIIVHKNETRHRVNSTIRKALGLAGNPVTGEPLLVLKNDYHLEVFNGEVVTFEGWKKYDGRETAVKDPWKNITQNLSFGVSSLRGTTTLLCPEQIRGETPLMSDGIISRESRKYWSQNYDEDDNWGDDYTAGGYPGDDWRRSPPHLHANFGYSLTCHKSQGSEWPAVLVLIEDSVRPTTYEGRRWLYTALTRSKGKCYFAVEA